MLIDISNACMVGSGQGWS